ncbi:MAG TPA: TonB family protein [Pyrinomonadaceae bacterium]|nr:TonB family protein [Pyrinomonadaceae bacterium]
MSRVAWSPKPSLRSWTLAALGAVALHAGFAALVIKYLTTDDYEELGAPSIEIGVELLAPRTEVIDLPVGPDVEASIASPPVVVQKDTIEPTVLPREVPIETEEPDRIVASIETEKPVNEETNTPTVPTPAALASIAAEATAPPSSELIESSLRSVAPAQGTGQSAERVRATWQKELIAHFNRHKRYPIQHSLPSATILVKFVLDETGHVLASNIVTGSGDASFDEAALAMIRRADPVPKPPAVVVSAGLDFTLPIIFRANRTN